MAVDDGPRHFEPWPSGTPELASPSTYFHTIPTGGQLSPFIRGVMENDRISPENQVFSLIFYKLGKYVFSSPDNAHPFAFPQRSSSPYFIGDETFNDSDIINNLINYEDGRKPDSLRAEVKQVEIVGRNPLPRKKDLKTILLITCQSSSPTSPKVILHSRCNYKINNGRNIRDFEHRKVERISQDASKARPFFPPSRIHLADISCGPQREDEWGKTP
ncbi:hypothetical protein TNCV_2534621 [Trichonephila clavipes]|nr:hypothetical protein TNCV_2534621 [Trichonephila clavipes]